MAWVPTNEIVQLQIEEFKQYADQAFDTAIDALNQIANTFSSTVGNEQGVDMPAEGGSGEGGPSIQAPDYVKPTPIPDTPSSDFPNASELPSPPTPADLQNKLNELQNKLASLRLPEFDEQPPALALLNAPNTKIPDEPDEPSDLQIPPYPREPNLDEPRLPTLQNIQIPTLDPPDLATIDALIDELRAKLPVAPEFPEPPDYPRLLDDQYAIVMPRMEDFLGCEALKLICPRLSDLLSGHSTGLLPPVATALRDRAFAAEDRLAFQAESEVLADWTARGFALPGGALEVRVGVVRQSNRDKKAQLNRDLWLEEAKLEIENLRFAITQGIVYEGMLRETWIKLYGIIQLLAAAQLDSHFKAVDFTLGVYKAQVEVWQTEFSTIETMLKVELSKLESYRLELEGQKLVGTINQQDIELYKTQWEAVKTQVDVYKTQVDAANSLLQAEIAKLEVSTKRVAIYSAKVSAYEAQWRAYGIAAQAEQSKSTFFESQTRAFATRVQAYGAQVDGLKSMGDLNVEAAKLLIQQWSSEVEKFKADLQYNMAKVDAAIKSSTIGVDIYRAKETIETGYTNYELKKLAHQLDAERLAADIRIKEDELAMREKDLGLNRDLALSKVALEALDGIARTGAQLAGSAMSAMNVGASLGSSSSSSDQYSESHIYNM